jgi:predicted ATP-dependent protease
MVEYGSRIADSQKKLTTRFGFLADMVREAHYWATSKNRDVVRAEDVLHGVEERIYRSNRIATRIRENMQDGKQLIANEGETIGQINGLYVSSVGDHMFGQPSRVTARTFVGKSGVVQIDREVNMAGPTHNKGVLTLQGYLGGKYADEVPLSVGAQITFEQNYSGVDGDSASSTELYALISSLAGIPIKQTIAVTGSVNQLGEVQAIGGVTHKVEGWYQLCAERGLTGEQGCMIPASNVADLMLRVHIVDAVRAGKFHIWAVSTIDEGLEVLTGIPAEELHRKAKARLVKLAELGARFES